MGFNLVLSIGLLHGIWAEVVAPFVLLVLSLLFAPVLGLAEEGRTMRKLGAGSERHLDLW